MPEFEYINESDLDSSRTGISIDPENRFPLLFMVVPEPPKAPYLAYHNGQNWVMVLGVPINDQGQPIDTRNPGEKLTDG